MLEKLLTPTNIMFVIGIVGMVFTIWEKVKKPQNELEKRQAVDRVAEQGNNKILEQRLQWEKETNDKRFMEMGTRLESAMTLAQNHTHTVDVKVDQLIKDVGAMNLSLTKEVSTLSAIINERVPKR